MADFYRGIETGGLLEASAAFRPGELASLLKAVPAKWVVYLLADDAGRPVQLLCVKNLRQSLKRRLGEPEVEALSKRADLREVVRQVRWRQVSSRFEADLVYAALAREFFPTTYLGLLPARPAWFLHVDPEAPFPQYRRTCDLTEPAGTYLGPIEDRTAAARLIEQIESAFDLCRYHNLLQMAPGARACPYKDMKRCPAPCDGSIAMEQYRRMVELSLRVLLDPADAVREHEGRMRQAAAELKFELAGRIKQYVGELSLFGKGPYRHARRLEDFRYAVLQRGPRKGTAKVFLVTASAVSEELGLIAEPEAAGPVLRHLLERLEQSPTESGTASETLAVVVHHLFATKNTSGIFLPLSEVDDKSLAKAYRELLKQKEPDPAAEEGEGVLQESDAIQGLP